MPIGRLLDDAILILLDLRKTGWSGGGGKGGSGGEGGEGQADIRWQCQPNGEILTAFGGSLRSR
jgi:hypothetical protein